MQIYKAALLIFIFSLLGPQLSMAAPESFQYYWEEFLVHELKPSDPMAQLINERLAESLFEAKNEDEFLMLSEKMRQTLKQTPEKWPHAVHLNNSLHREFARRLAQEKRSKKIYSATGAVVGTLIALPAGYFLSKKFGSRIFWLLVPVGAGAGFGAGWFFSHLRNGLRASGVSDVWTGDVEDIFREIDQMD